MMDTTFFLVSTLTAGLFAYYGVECLRSEAMRLEFERFGIPMLRVAIGWLEILGAAGLIVGWFVPLLGLAAAGGLTILMVAVVVSRVRLRDSLAETAPAVVCALLTAFLVAYHLGQ